MLVSFVVPTRNQAPFLRRCLDSCLGQGVVDSEILVRDGASTDGTQAILASYGDRVRWVSEPDGGQADAVNKAVADARGEVIAWINSDDAYASAGALRPVLSAFEDPDVDVVFGEALLVAADGTPIRRYRTPGGIDVRSLLRGTQGPSQPATFFRRELFLRVGGLRSDLHYALDYDLWLRLFAAARGVRRVPGVVALMTSHPAAKSIRAMAPHIRELARVRRAHAARLRASAYDRLRMAASLAWTWTYYLAVRAGLRRAT